MIKMGKSIDQKGFFVSKGATQLPYDLRSPGRSLSKGLVSRLHVTEVLLN